MKTKCPLSKFKKNIALLKAIYSCSEGEVQKLLNSTLTKLICELSSNTLKGNLKLSDFQKRKLSKHQDILRKLGKRGGRWREKKKIIVLAGKGLISALIGPFLGLLLRKVFKKDV